MIAATASRAKGAYARNQRLCVCGGPALFVTFLVGCLVADFIPPPPAHLGNEEIKQIFVDHAQRIRAGMYLMMMGSALLIPWVAAISTQLRRIEGRSGPLSQTQLVAGSLGMLLFLIAAMVWLTMAFRPSERSGETLSMFHDFAAFFFVGIPCVNVVQNACIALLTFQDRSPSPVFPRWVGYFNVWVALTFLSGPMVMFFRSGPFAWNGAFSWWIPLSSYAAWIAVMSVMCWRAIGDEEREARAEQGRDGSRIAPPAVASAPETVGVDA